MGSRREQLLRQMEEICDQMSRIYEDFGVHTRCEDEGPPMLVIDEMCALPMDDYGPEALKGALNKLETDLLVGRMRKTLHRLHEISDDDESAFQIYRKETADWDDVFDPLFVGFAGAIFHAVRTFKDMDSNQQAFGCR